MENCNEIKELIYEFIENELDLNQKVRFDEHIKVCEECRNELNEAVRLMELCKDMPEEELPQDFGERLHVKLTAEKNLTDSRNKNAFLVKKYFAICSTVAAALVIAILIKGLSWNSHNSTSNSAVKNKIVYEKDQAKAGTLASESPTYSIDEKVKSDETSDKNSKSFSDVNPQQNLRKEAKKGKSIQSANTEPSSTDRIAESNAAGKGETNRDKAATAGNENQSDLMLTVTAQDTTKPYELKNINISFTSSNNIADTQKIKDSVTSYGAEVISDSPHEIINWNQMNTTDTDHAISLKLKVPDSSYKQFVDFLNDSFSSGGIEFGKLIVTDISQQIKEYENKISMLSQETSIQESTTDGSLRKDSMDALTKAQGEMNQLKKETEYTTVIIVVKNST